MGTLAGSTVMLLTIAWGGSILLGHCDLDEQVGWLPAVVSPHLCLFVPPLTTRLAL
jgi:hypothetical protein